METDEQNMPMECEFEKENSISPHRSEFASVCIIFTSVMNINFVQRSIILTVHISGNGFTFV